MSLYNTERVFVLRPGTTTNRARETVLDRSGLEQAAGYPRDLVHVHQRPSSEAPADDRQGDVSIWDLSTEPYSGDWDVLATDWIRLPDGTIGEVVGDARKGKDEAGVLHHVEVTIRQVK